ncbi:MAG: TIGR04255 family protein [Thermoguttaceae bacterium]
MPRKDLKNKPLVEAILEIRWHLLPLFKAEGQAQMMVPGRDPHYRLLLARLFDRLQGEYPVHEQLATANLPDDMLGQVVQHRFRSAKDEWPLVQVGPGVFTVNDTHGYTWTDFQQRAREAVVRLYDAHPSVAELRIQSLVLRYIDAVEYNYKEENAFAFLRDKMKLGVSLPDSLFQNTGVESRPQSFSWQAMFQCSKPPGAVHVSFATGQREDKPAILWETTVQSAGDDLPNMPDEFPGWFDAAHEITDEWFFKLIEGELERRFEGD